MTIQLIAIDIDDTLLSSRGHLLASTITAVQRAVARGVKVVLCTGRPLAGVQPFLTQLGITGDDQYVITYNGAVTESVAGRVVAKHLIDNADYRKLTAFGQARHVPFHVLDEHSTVYTADRDVNWVTVIQAWENKAGVLVRQPDELPTDFQIAKGAFVGDAPQLDAVETQVKQAFSDDLYVVRADANFLECMPAGVNKGQALKDLATILDLAPAAVMAIGDGQNDLPMFAFAETAVAMGNAVPAAKAAATAVTTSQDEGGVAAAIEKFVLAN
ncbi:Cof-type HAD-IIB family hydrolase [Lactiplantibacillus plajomi]|uniref:Cof-type HAD-IIB family hydrolase n=1 Tax=Lactiplantibacillus plajomi TaxID=1457217 RepID=A0ABV6K8X9_9LACO|nr:Cof-type HAD-IIB family hydrolase [Lactiplantibacillus plajomi]